MNINRYLIVLFLMLLPLCLSAQNSISLLPEPADYVLGCCTYSIDSKAKIKGNIDKSALKFFEEYIHNNLFSRADVHKNGDIKTIMLCQHSALDAPKDAKSADFYTIQATDGKSIRIEATTERAVFYAIQTLLQLVGQNGRIQSATIADYPRFEYRGLMIDCSRHFWDKEYILKQIDVMAQYKMSHLHLHLTDAAGWRIESKMFPRLTEVGAFRTESDWNNWWVSGNDRQYVEFVNDDYLKSDVKYNDPDSHPYGGFYTQSDLREIVSYAAKRYITIVPEIEMPGHSDEVIAAYPNLSCGGEAYLGGEFCIGNEEVFSFLETILNEVMDIFPSEYIHIGGDEASRKSWETCPKCLKRMEDEELKTTAELQSYMTERIERMLNKRGRRLMGWDEILEGYLAPNATVMSWRGTEGGLKAAMMSHDVVMSPGGYCYLDAYQDAPGTQPRAFGSFTPLSRTYSFDPVAPELKGTDKEKYIKGIQGNLWAEMIQTPNHMEYMLWPRGLAIAEIGWSRSHDNYTDFKQRAIAAVKSLHQQGINAFSIDNEVGNRIESEFLIEHEALGKHVNYLANYADVYKGSGNSSLTDGMSGNWSYADGRWQGFINRPRFDVVVDMDSIVDLHDITVNFMQFAGPEIFVPGEVEFLVSDDGDEFVSIFDCHNDVSRNPDYFILPVEWRGSMRGRYVRVKASSGKYGGWIFTDEVFINKK